MRAGTVVAVILTAIVTAAVTSAVWLAIFNLRERQIEQTTKTATVTRQPPAKPVAPAQAPPRSATALPVEGQPDLRADYQALAQRRLTIPVSGIIASHLTDTFEQSRGNGARVHEAIDIMAPHGTPVVATEDGTIAKFFDSVPGGITIYQFDPSASYAYYYAHLDRRAEGLAEGQQVKRGQVIGYVGSTGNASAEGPHLHFGIFKLGPEKNWYEGTPINPFPVLGGTVQASHTLTSPKR